jgi:uncharacterized protein (TIGR02646 family)
MEKIDRPSLNKIPSLQIYEDQLLNYCRECKDGKRKWESKSNLYLTLRNELKNLTESHCSFCDGYPLKVTSKETIEHFFPKKEYPELTYSWNNLFYCCDQCQSYANGDMFSETIIRPDQDYDFERLFYFDPLDGEIKIIECIETQSMTMFDKAKKILERYGINKNKERLQARQTMFFDAINLLKSNSLGDSSRPYRAVVRTAKAVFENIKTDFE